MCNPQLLATKGNNTTSFDLDRVPTMRLIEGQLQLRKASRGKMLAGGQQCNESGFGAGREHRLTSSKEKQKSKSGHLCWWPDD